MGEIVSNELWNSYFYENTEVLINKYGEKNQEKLKEIEVIQSFDKLLELSDNLLDISFDKAGLKEIHNYIFKEIYPFAGEYRRVNITKKRGSFLIARSTSDFDEYLDELFNNTNQQLIYCHVMYQFADILAKLYTSLIYCHPFREGNGRCIREFIREFSIVKSKEVGLEEVELDWELIDKEELNKYIEVAHLFPGSTTILFNKALVPVNNNIKGK